ncbi:hypothetical protein JYT74_02695 [Crocinitomix catalasitica]|nr:hypothetical protein [Crocinitomix catalasitica]
MSFVAIGFIVLSALMIFIFCYGYNAALQRLNYMPQKIRRKVLLLLVFFSFWIVYMILISRSGVLYSDSLPPRIPLLIFFPVFQFSFVIILIKKNRELIKAIPQTALIYVQSFRILVEFLILGMYIEHIVPQAATFEGYNFEIVTGLIALVVAYFVQKGSIGRKGILAWNFAGLFSLAIIIFIITTSFYFPSFWCADVPLVTKEFSQMPYLLLAGILAPMAACFHLISIKQQKLLGLMQ